MHKLRTVTSLHVSAVAGHHAMPAALLLQELSPFGIFSRVSLVSPTPLAVFNGF